MNRFPMDPVDAAWWRMDSPTNRMAIVAVMGFDRPFSQDAFADLLRERLSPFERFRLKVVSPGGRPHWEEDPDFDFSRHVVSAGDAPPATEDELKLLAGRLMSEALPSDRPPWQFVVIENFGEGAAVVARLHHAIADGLALIHVLNNLADGTEASTTLVSRPNSDDPDDTDELEEMLEPVPERRFQWSDLWRWFRNLPGLTLALAKFAFTGSDKRTRLRGRQGVDKRVDWSPTMDLKTLRRTAVRHSATINDLLLAVLSGGLRRYLEQYRAVKEDFELRAIIPVNLRHRHEELGLGNRFGLVILALPVGLKKLASRVKEVHRRMLEARKSMEPVAAFGLLAALGRGPGFVENAAVWKLSATSSAAITHVPGPRRHLVLAGRTLRDLMFWVPRGGSVTMGFSILTYAGRARIGVATDAGLITDPNALTAGISSELVDVGLT